MKVDGIEVGVVTSGTKSPTLGYGIAMGYIAKAHAKIGTKIQVDIRGKIADAVVVKASFAALYHLKSSNNPKFFYI